MRSLAHIAIFCNNLDLMEIFYIEVFSMWTFWKMDDDKAYLTSGNLDIFGLLQKKNHKNKKIDFNNILGKSLITPKIQHFGLVLDSIEEFNELLIKIKSMGIDIVGNKISRDETKSFYFEDPEKNPVQVVYFPKKLMVK